jgi:hypothetical protein
MFLVGEARHTPSVVYGLFSQSEPDLPISIHSSLEQAAVPGYKILDPLVAVHTVLQLRYLSIET